MGAKLDVIEGPAGLFGAYFGGRFDRTALDGGFGEEWRLLDARFKPWPVSGVVQPYVEAALALASPAGLPAADLSRVVIRGNAGIRPWCEPAGEKRRPRSAAAGADSIPFATATALARGRLGLEDITGEALRDPVTLEIAARIHCELSDAPGEEGSLDLVLAGGRTLHQRLPPPLGGIERPLDRARLSAKFRDCARHAAAPVSAPLLDALERALWSLETAQDIGAVTALARGEALCANSSRSRSGATSGLARPTSNPGQSLTSKRECGED